MSDSWLQDSTQPTEIYIHSIKSCQEIQVKKLHIFLIKYIEVSECATGLIPLYYHHDQITRKGNSDIRIFYILLLVTEVYPVVP